MHYEHLVKDQAAELSSVKDQTSVSNLGLNSKFSLRNFVKY